MRLHAAGPRHRGSSWRICRLVKSAPRPKMCELSHTGIDMATNLALDPALLDKVLVISGQSTKKAAVTLALREFIARREQQGVTELFGKLDWDPSYDYKAERSRS